MHNTFFCEKHYISHFLFVYLQRKAYFCARKQKTNKLIYKQQNFKETTNYGKNCNIGRDYAPSFTAGQ